MVHFKIVRSTAIFTVHVPEVLLISPFSAACYGNLCLAVCHPNTDWVSSFRLKPFVVELTFELIIPFNWCTVWQILRFSCTSQ